MNKKVILGCIALVLLLPLLSLGPRENQTVQMYLMKCLVPLLMVTVFLVNYYKLIPRAMKRYDKSNILLNNVVIIAFCCLMMAAWHRFEFTTYHKEKERTEAVMAAKEAAQRGEEVKRPARDNGRRFWITAAFFDGLNFTFAIFVAYSMRSSERINNLQKKQKEAEVARQKAELKGLRNQISPHFLLNTLNNIYALAAISAERTQSAVMQLSKLLRHMLYDNQSEMVTLRSEADFISSYIDLMKLRLASNVTITTDINIAQASQTTVAPLLFISLVENAFKHGVSSTEPCSISITLKEDADNIVCDIINSNHPKTPADRSGHGIGLHLVQQRLDTVYKGCHEWTKGVADDNMYHSKITIKKL